MSEKINEQSSGFCGLGIVLPKNTNFVYILIVSTQNRQRK